MKWQNKKLQLNEKAITTLNKKGWSSKFLKPSTWFIFPLRMAVSINAVSASYSLKGKIWNTFMFPRDMSSYFNSKLLIRISALPGLFKPSTMIMSDCVLKVSEMETKLKTLSSLAATLAASIQKKATPILSRIYNECNIYTLGKIRSLYKSRACHCKQGF